MGGGISPLTPPPQSYAHGCTPSSPRRENFLKQTVSINTTDLYNTDAMCLLGDKSLLRYYIDEFRGMNSLKRKNGIVFLYVRTILCFRAESQPSSLNPSIKSTEAFN